MSGLGDPTGTVPGPRPSLGDLEGRQYRTDQRRFLVMLSTGMAAMSLVGVVLNAVLGNGALAGLYGVMLVLFVTAVVGARRQRVVLLGEGLRVHDGLRRPRLVPWQDVREVRAPNRWSRHTTLRWGPSREVSLPEMSPGEAKALAAWLRTGRTGGTPSSGC